MTALTTSLPAEFQVAEVDYAAIAPMLVVFGGAIIGVLVEAFAPRAVRYTAQVAVAVASLVIALVALVTISIDARASRWSEPSSSTARRCSCRARSC